MCEGVPLDAIAQKNGTPVYVYSRAAIRAAYLGLDRALGAALGPQSGNSPHRVCYAVKANSNLSVLREFAKLGSGFDIVSGGELERLRRIGVAGNRIVFSGVGKTREEIAAALKAGILLFNVESAAELDVLESRSVAIAAGRARSVASESGCCCGRASAYRHRQASAQIWSGLAPRKRTVFEILRAEMDFVAGNQRAHWFAGVERGAVQESFAEAGWDTFAIWRRPACRCDISILAAGWACGTQMKSRRRFRITRGRWLPSCARLRCTVLVEPGRAMVAQAGVLLMRVLYTKQTGGKTFVVVDAAMNDFIRPALYDAVHPITRVTKSPGSRKIRDVAVVGPVCETGDVFLNSWPMEDVVPGDVLALWGAGAYGFAQCVELQFAAAASRNHG